jgi:hypothetical protein
VAELTHQFTQRTVQDIINLYEDDCLNLSPGFQRDSVWTERDRAKLVDSIVRNYPLPALFLYRREHNGEIVYDVIDGKQRIESILMFTGLIRGKRFWAKVQLPDGDEKEWVDWNTLRSRKQQHLITGYRLNTVEVDGETADIIDLFVRINSTGKALTAAEKRHAKYYNSEFLKMAGKLANRLTKYFRKAKILSTGQISRMKHVELVCELMISIYQGDVINKKAVLDRVMKADSLSDSDARKARDRTLQAINRVKRMFPKLAQTRFHQLSDYYSLVVLIAKFESEGLILTDRRRNKLAWDLLKAFSNGVDEVRLRQKKAQGPKPGQESYREYLLTVLQATDEISQRRKREEILRGLLQNLFEKRDSDRLFSIEQRRILWNSAAVRKCARCHKPVTWQDLTIDHIDPWSRGGRTELDNAALMHRECNAAQGNRRR